MQIENYRIQMKVRKVYNTNKNLYNTNGKYRILQRLTCHKNTSSVLPI